VCVTNEAELRDAIANGADILSFSEKSLQEFARWVTISRQLAPAVAIEYSGSNVSLENVGSYAEAGADMICIGRLTNSAPAIDITFQIQPF
jgi:nicotinate-nucleotide pyrophosphorylase (carboxylating)